MIKTDYIPREVKHNSCDNCNREMPFVIKLSFCESNGKEYNRLHLCEDCANAVSNLLHATMKAGKNFKYDYDEIKEIKEEK